MNSLATMDTAKGRSEDSGNGAGGAVNGLNDPWKRLLAAMTATGELETIARASSALGELEGIRTQMGTVHAAFEFTDGSAGAPSQTARDRAKERIKGISVWRMARSDYSGWQVVIMGEREAAVDKGRRLCVAAGGVARELEPDLVEVLRACRWDEAAARVLDALRTGSAVPKAFRGLVQQFGTTSR